MKDQDKNNSQKKATYKKPELKSLGDIRDVTMGSSFDVADSGTGMSESGTNP